jgi:ankyrin repeat protein
MYYLARFGRAKIAEFLLNGFEINLNDKDYNQQSPIFYAARDNQIAIVDLFVSKGADVNLKDEND